MVLSRSVHSLGLRTFTVLPCVFVGSVDVSGPSFLAAIGYGIAAVELLYLVFWMSRAGRAGGVLFEFSRPNRKWWWLASANMAIAVTTFLYGYGAETSRAMGVLFLSQAVVLGAQARCGVQARERGLLMPFEFVPWKRVDFCWTEPNRVSVTVRRSLNWNTTYAFTVSIEHQAEIANLQRISAASAH